MNYNFTISLPWSPKKEAIPLTKVSVNEAASRTPSGESASLGSSASANPKGPEETMGETRVLRILEMGKTGKTVMTHGCSMSALRLLGNGWSLGELGLLGLWS